MKILAGVFKAIEAHTPYGGVSVSYEPVGSAWLKLGARRRRQRSEPGGVRVVEVVTAETRADPRLIAGRVLRFGGGDWGIQTTETVGGRAILMLERSR